MKIKLILLLACALQVSGEERPPQIVTLEGQSPVILTSLDYMWSRPGHGCGLLNFYLFEYTDKHPDRIKFSGDDEVATIEGFYEYLLTKSPIFVRGLDEDTNKYSLIFFRGAILTPWGDEIVFLVDRDKDGYLTAFGDRRSVNHQADPWKVEGFKYSKAVGITLKRRPKFMGGDGSVTVPLDDNEYSRLKDSILPNKQAEQGGRGQPATRSESR